MLTPNDSNTYTAAGPSYAAADDAIYSVASIPSLFFVRVCTSLSITFTVSLATNKVRLFSTVVRVALSAGLSSSLDLAFKNSTGIKIEGRF